MREAGERYRFGYQGEFAEQDDETGWNAFELRMYDSKIGRWMATDPYREYSSPYLAMGNNPMSLVDPDGGCTDPACVALAYGQAIEAAGIGIGATMGALLISSVYLGYNVGGPIVDAHFEQSIDFIASMLLSLGVQADALYPKSVLDIDGNLLPVIGDVTLVTGVPHGNRKDNPNSHIVYEIFGIGGEKGYTTLKFGIADEKYNTYNGQGNSRPTGQLVSLRAKYPHMAISYTIWSRTNNRAQALAVEGVLVTAHVVRYGKLPREQILPKPFKFK